jgi:hypothetical protein
MDLGGILLLALAVYVGITALVTLFLVVLVLMEKRRSDG